MICNKILFHDNIIVVRYFKEKSRKSPCIVRLFQLLDERTRYIHVLCAKILFHDNIIVVRYFKKIAQESRELTLSQKA